MGELSGGFDGVLYWVRDEGCLVVLVVLGTGWTIGFWWWWPRGGGWSRARKVDRYAGRMTGSVACRTRSM